MRYSLLIFLNLVFFLSCNNDKNTSSTNQQTSEKISTNKQSSTKCKYGQPVAVFSESLAQIEEQSFEVNGQKGVEIVKFKDGKYLELYQSGCNDIRQEYRFTIKGNHKDKDAQFWFDEAVRQLTYVVQLDERYTQMGLWIGELNRIAERLELGQFTEAQANTFIMLDKIVETESAMVIIVFEGRS